MPPNQVSRVEALEGLALPDALLKALREEKTIAGVARRWNVDRATVYDWMRVHGIERQVVVTATS